MPTVTTLSGTQITLDLGTRDFEGYRSDVISSGGLADQYTPDWTDRSELDLGVALTEVFGYIGDSLSYYQDRCANEALPLSCTRRKSMIEHSRFLGYELRPNISASVELTFVANGAGTLPIKTQVSVDTSDGSEDQTFELEAAFVVPGAGTYTGKVALHGESTTDTPTSSDGSAGQTLELEGSPLAINPDGTSSLEIWVTEGGPAELWTEVTKFHESEPTDKVYRVEIDEDDIVTVIFGDGVTGKKPASGIDNIQPIYRVGGGTDGNQVGIGKLTRLVGSYSFIDSVTNPAVPSGGRPKETIEEARINAPLSLVALNRAVRHGDYKALALEVSGVSKAKAYKDPYVGFKERVVISAGGSNPVPTGTWNSRTGVGTGLIGSVGAYLDARKTVPCIIEIDPVCVVEISMNIRVNLFPNIRQEIAQRYIEDALSTTLDVDAQDMGEQIPLSLISKVIEDLQGVDYVTFLRFQRKPYARKISDTSSDCTFDDVVYGAETPTDTWSVEFTSPTAFKVYGVDTGLQVNTGTIGVAYLVDNGGFGFTVTAGAVAPIVSEVWEIVTGKYICQNIDPDEFEVCKLLGDTFTLSLVGGVG